MGHLVIEKLLKACYINSVGINYPRIHDLNVLANRIGLEVTESQKKQLDLVTGFNIEARYSDYKFDFYKKADYEFSLKGILAVKELREWLLEKL